MGRVINIDNCVPSSKAQTIYFKNYLFKAISKDGLSIETKDLIEGFLKKDSFKKAEMKNFLNDLTVKNKELLKKYIKNFNVNKNKDVKPSRKSEKHTPLRFDIPERKYKKLVEKLRVNNRTAKEFFESAVDKFIT